MANRKATAVIEASGGFKKNPQRKRVDPPCTGEVGAPPDYFAENEKVVWQELIGTSPQGVLKASDRSALEIASTLLADYRKDRASFNPARLTALQKALASLGRTPVDRSRLAAPEPVKDPNDPWAKLIRDYG